jgi:citrate lyase subunit beta/citryl-CoA lyase
VVIADLEDAVSRSEKAAARELVARLFGEIESRCAKTVRVNGADTDLFEDDLTAVAGLDLDGIVLPKATPEAVTAVRDAARGLTPEEVPILAIIESARGLRLAYETADSAQVAALVLGAADLGAELGLEPRADGQEILYARSKLVVDSAAAGIRPPIDVVHLDTRDEAGLEAEALLARSLGFGGKMCIHPTQLPAVNRAFAPSAEQLAWAHAVVGAYEEGLREGRGAVALDGVLVDLPVVERARKILGQAALQEGVGVGHTRPAGVGAGHDPPDRPMEETK